MSNIKLLRTFVWRIWSDIQRNI